MQHYILTFPLICDIIEIPKGTEREDTRRTVARGFTLRTLVVTALPPTQISAGTNLRPILRDNRTL